MAAPSVTANSEVNGKAKTETELQPKKLEEKGKPTLKRRQKRRSTLTFLTFIVPMLHIGVYLSMKS